MKIYRAILTNDEIEIFLADNDSDAMREAFGFETRKIKLFNLEELDENYDYIRTVF